jgi:predicted transposase YbfD/YdcC
MRTIFPPPHTERDKNHGRIETRTIRTSTLLNNYIDFPHIGQVFRIERTTTDLKGENKSCDVAYGITSLTADEADPKRLLRLARGHWQIETSLFWVRDVTFDEDRSQIRTGSAPQAFATLRNLAISLFRLKGFTNMAAALRRHSWNPERALSLVGL